MVQLWFQASTACKPNVEAGAVTAVARKSLRTAPRPTAVATRVVVVTALLSGSLIEGVIEFRLCAVPTEIVAWDGTKSGSVSAWARLKKICRLVSELNDEARSAVL